MTKLPEVKALTNQSQSQVHRAYTCCVSTELSFLRQKPFWSTAQGILPNVYKFIFYL